MKKYKALFILNRSIPAISGSEKYIYQIIKSLKKVKIYTDIITLNVLSDSDYVKRNKPLKSCEKIENINIKRYNTISIFSQHKIFHQLEKTTSLKYIFGFNKIFSFSLIGGIIDRIKKYDFIFTGIMPYTQIIYPTITIAKLFNKKSILIPLMHFGQHFDYRYKYEYFSSACINLYKKADTIIVINQFEKDFLIKNNFKGKIIEINPYITKHGINDKINNFNFISIGYHNYEKGIETTLKAFYMFNREFNNSKLFLIGKVDKKYIKFLNNKNIYYFENISNEKKYELLRKSHVFLLPSIAESFGIATIEAHSLGLPSINAYCSGSQYVIENGKNGFLIPFGDELMMYEYMKKLYIYKELYGKMSRNAHLMSERFDYINHFKQIEKLKGVLCENNALY